MMKLVESQIGLIGYAVGGCRIDDEGIKLAEGAEDVILAILGLCLVDDALGYLVEVCIETYAEKTLLLANLLNQFLTGHDYFLLYKYMSHTK